MRLGELMDELKEIQAKWGPDIEVIVATCEEDESGNDFNVFATLKEVEHRRWPNWNHKSFPTKRHAMCVTLDGRDAFDD